MKKCKYCQTEIDDNAKICPNCKKKQSKKGIIALCIVVVIIIIAIANGGNNTSTTSDNLINTTTQTQEKFTLLDGHTGSYDEYGMGYYIEGTVQNNTDKEYSYVQITFNLYDKDNALLGTAVSNVNNFEANGKWKFKAIGLNSSDDKVTSYKFKEITGY
jgi:RNA polymerase subunit RPABC4/transcription elongation factor Spt4